MILALALLVQALPAGEEPVDPYVVSNANAGATPVADPALWRAFHEGPGVGRVVDGMVDRVQKDARIADIFKGQDLVRLRRVLREHFCHILGGGCDYTGRTMKDAHRNLGVQRADMGALVENLQASMRAEGVPFAAQNRFLAKLAPMHRDVVER
ncbi:globin [Sphingomonas sp. Leaf412]|uniref:group I truncated hemoglobin n=1 Tax=Sphingomonas sp. Leaf412 TaxID=1736370 RepID=UPI0006FB1BBF|nr:group 1 truncated hemoglobin [Sphingomonas sp. Leaf412]KQT31410.1 globin [Sphingomonas sp. Leaf412]